jgi:hypothetical protein
VQKNIFAVCALFFFLIISEVLVGSDSGELLSEPKKAEIDTQLRVIWTDLRSALADKDAEKALTYFQTLSREHYRELFDALGENLPEAAREMQNIEPVYIKRSSAKYEMQKNELCGDMRVNIIYSVHFLVDSDGLWKIERY